MVLKLILMMAMMIGPVVQPETNVSQHESSATRTTVIYKSPDSQGVDVIWLEACMDGGCEG